MSLHVIEAAMGNGKTLYSVDLIIEELLHGNRVIVTNVPLFLGVLQSYCDKKTTDIEKAVDVTDRVRLLSHEETKRFFCCFDGNLTLPFYGTKEWKSLTEEQIREHYSPCLRPILWVIDEAHEIIPATEWAEVGRQALHHVSHCRKLGSRIILISQAVGNIAKPYRRLVQDYTKMRNMKKEKLGRFALPNLFQRRTASDEHYQEIQEVREFKLDLEIASCYDTSAGVGIHSRQADKLEKAKGIPFWFIIAGVVGAVVLSIILLFALKNWSESKWKKKMHKEKVPAVAPALKPEFPNVRPDKKKTVTNERSLVEKIQPPLSSVHDEKPTYFNGIVKIGSRVVVYMTDGESVDSDDSRLQYVGKDYVIISGKVIKKQPANFLTEQQKFPEYVGPKTSSASDKVARAPDVPNIPQTYVAKFLTPTESKAKR